VAKDSLEIFVSPSSQRFTLENSEDGLEQLVKKRRSQMAFARRSAR
jgi:hypothetical protein